MGRQRNNPQMTGKEEVSETMLNEEEASQLSDVEFKALVIRKLNELTQNYQKLQGTSWIPYITCISYLWAWISSELYPSFASYVLGCTFLH